MHPCAWHHGLIKDAASYVGSLIDFPFKLVRPISFLPGGGDITEMYKSLPTDSLKRKYDEYISQDPINASRYMAEYLNSRGTEVATKMGISPAFQDMFMPSDNIGEQWRRTIFGVLGAGATAASRTYVGLGLRDVDGRILNAADVKAKFAAEGADVAPPNKPEDLAELVQREKVQWETLVKSGNIKL